MSSAAALQRWSSAKVWLFVALVFAGQLAFIFWLGRHVAARPRRAEAAPVIQRISDQALSTLAVEDPTLFALPRAQGFSGEAWLKISPDKFHPATWSEPNQWLQPPATAPGADFKAFMQTHASPEFQVVAMPQPELPAPAPAPASPLSPPSVVHVEGPLQTRPLLSRFDLKGWPNTDLLTNSVVRVFVDDRGATFSPVLLSGSGSPEADREALRLARDARFAPVPPTGPDRTRKNSADMTSGTMIFEWQTLPLTLTNAPATGT